MGDDGYFSVIYIEEHNALWPIPQSEIDYYAVHGVELRQNPGY